MVEWKHVKGEGEANFNRINLATSFMSLVVRESAENLSQETTTRKCNYRRHEKRDEYLVYEENWDEFIRHLKMRMKEW